MQNLVIVVVVVCQWKKRHVIGYFDSEDSHDYSAVFKKIASVLRDDCSFHAAIG